MDIDTFVRRLHEQPVQAVLALTGGGSLAIGELLAEPGGSRILLEAVVPYAAAALADWLGAPPEQFCAPRTARAMAMQAFQRVWQLTSEPRRICIGLGCTASLASEPPKRGPHRVHIAWQSAAATVTASFELLKGQRSRREEEHLVALLTLNQLADACGLSERLSLPLVDSETVVITRTDAPAAWQALLTGETAAICARPAETGRGCPESLPLRAPGAAWSGEGWGEGTAAIFPGAFDPLHAGHRRMAEVAADLLNMPVAFELSVTNVDKPPLDYTEIEQRIAQFADREIVWLTRAPTFVEKAALFPGCTFVVGADTVTRIADAKYYGNDASRVRMAIEAIAAHGCRFLVFGRTRGGKFETLSDLALPDELRRLCQEVPAAVFREDVSSTVLRRTAGPDAEK